MKKNAYLKIAMILLCASSFLIISCTAENVSFTPDTQYIKTYREIPGITEDEIAAIEELKSSRSSFSYCSLTNTEAFVLDDGTKAGYILKFCELLTRLFEIPFVHEFSTWDFMMNRFHRYSVDFIGGLTPTPERNRIYFMTSPIAERSLTVFINNKNIAKINSSDDLNGLKIGFFEGTITDESIHTFYPHLIYEITDVKNTQEAVRLLSAGTIDAFITDSVISYEFTDYGFISGINLLPLVYTPVSMSTANPALAPVISAVNKFIMAGGIDELYLLYAESQKEFAKFSFSKSLSQSERNYIASLIADGGKVPVAFENGNYPVSFYNRGAREFQGIGPDIIKEVSNLSGLEFEIKTSKDSLWHEILGMLQSGEAAMVTELLYTEERKDKFLWSERAIAVFNYGLLSKTDHPDLKPYQVIREPVGLVRSTGFVDIFKTLFPDHTNIQYFDSVMETLNALRNDKIHMYMASESELLSFTNLHELSGYKMNLTFTSPLRESFLGFNKDEVILKSIFDKALSVINTDAYIKDWKGRTFNYERKYAEERSVYLTVFSVLLTALLFVLVWLLIKNKKMQQNLQQMIRRIDKRNNLLKIVNDMSAVLLEPNMKNFNFDLLESMGTLATAVNVDRLYIWKNHVKDDELYCTQLYEWSEGAEPQQGNEYTMDVPYSYFPNLLDIFKREECVNGIVRDMNPELKNHLSSQGILSILMVPVFLDNELWGFVGYDDCSKERVFTGNEEIILRSAGRMLVNALIRHEMNREIINTSKQLEEAMQGAYEVNRINSRFRNTLENILNSLDSLVYVTVPETGEILFINEHMREHYHLEHSGIGHTCYKLFTENTERCEFCPCNKLDNVPGMIVKWTGFNPKTNRHYRHTDRYITWTDGKLVHLQNSVDVTELITAKEQAEQSNRFKTQFLSRMSHEIRTPMNAILGITEIQLQDETLPLLIREAFSRIFNSGDLLLGIINDILDLSKIESGKMELILDKYDVSSLIHDTVQLNVMRYESKPIKFDLDIDENVPMELIGDEIRIKQIMNNLLSNAFKYTKEGTINIHIWAESGGEDSQEIALVFRVSDTGQGMTPEQVERLGVDEFSRFNLQANRATEGSGLGMNITRNLIQLMRGKILIESEPGKGSVFTVYLPQKKTEEKLIGKELAENLKLFTLNGAAKLQKARILREFMPYGRVLVVDDVETNLYVARGLMAPYGLSIDTSLNGYDAIKKFEDGCDYDIIFMDHMMPKMDGIEATGILRNMGCKKPIIALTANALAGQAQMFLDCGFDGYISKPIDVRHLNMLLNKYIRDIQPPEVIKAAREQMSRLHTVGLDDSTSNPQLAEIFLNDARKAIELFEAIHKNNCRRADDLSSFVINIHAMKSALANIGASELSMAAQKLETAGRERNIEQILQGIPAFVSALREVTKKIKEDITKEGEEVDENSPEIRTLLHEKLSIVKTAAGTFDKLLAEETLAQLQTKAWSSPVKERLDIIGKHLLHSEFEEAANIAGEFITQLSI